jgi:hypothetical protein
LGTLKLLSGYNWIYGVPNYCALADPGKNYDLETKVLTRQLVPTEYGKHLCLTP